MGADGKRADRLVYDGGEHGRYYSGVPARDLEAADIAQLSDEEYARITGGPDPVYRAEVPAAAKPAGKEKG